MISLTTVKVTKSYKGRKVVRDVSLSVGQGEVVGLLGPNGAGKTTTFYMIVGLTRPDSGSVFLGEHDITSLPMYLRAKNGISYLPQEASVFRKLTVEANIMAILETLPLSNKERRERMESLLEEFGIAHVRETLQVTDRAYIINNGSIFRSGTPQELGNDAEVKRVYLGEHFSLN